MLALVALFIFAFACFGKPKHAFGVALIAQTLYIVPAGFDVATYSFLIIFIRTVLLKLVIRRKVILNDLLKVFLFLYIISIVSLIVFRGQYALEMVISYSRVAIVLFLFFHLFKTKEDLNLIVRYIFIALILVLIHVFTQALFINPLASPEYKFGRLRPHGLTDQLVNPNSFSIIIVWSIGLLMNYYWVYRPKKIKFGKLFSLVLLPTMLALSLPVLGLLSSRSSMLVLVIAVIFSIFKINLKRLAFGGFSAVLLLLIFNTDLKPSSDFNIPFIGETANKRFNQISDESDDSNKWSRSALAKAGFTVFLQNPLFGVGLGNEKRAIRDLTGESKVSHNSFVGIVAELGLFGLFFLILFFYSWHNVIHLSTTLNLFVLVGLYGLVHNIFLMNFTWFMLAFNYRLTMLQYQTQKQHKMALLNAPSVL